MRPSTGRHGDLALLTIFRLGGLTGFQLRQLHGLSRSTAALALKRLERAGLAGWSDLTLGGSRRGGRPHRVYHLWRRGAVGVVAGGFLAGIEDADEARSSYGRCQVPSRAAHAWLRNEYLALLAADCRRRSS